MVNFIGLELAPELRVPHKVAIGGTMVGWRDAMGAIAEVSTDCPHWALAAAAGFASPVQSKCGFDTCGFNFSGPTSRGKTTGQGGMVSPWSNPDIKSGGLLRSMRATENSLEVSARQSNNMGLCLDDLAHVDGKAVGRALYFLAGGVSKARMTVNLTMRPMFGWVTFIILSCEQSLADKITGAGGEWTGGMAVRFPDIDCSDVNTRIPRATMARINGIYQNYGHAGGAFVTAFKHAGLHHEPKTGELRTQILNLADELAGENADSALRRAALPFAIVGVSGNLAQSFGFLPEKMDITAAVKWGWQHFSFSHEARALTPEDRALGNLRQWLAEHWDSAIKEIRESSAPVTQPPSTVLEVIRTNRDALGWYDKFAIYVPTERMREATGGVMSALSFIRWLERRGMLQMRPSSGRLAIRSVPGVGKVDCYALKHEGFRDV